ncbi:hypothetical protein Tco_0230080, partial [Tanacetum coccineum]
MQTTEVGLGSIFRTLKPDSTRHDQPDNPTTRPDNTPSYDVEEEYARVIGDPYSRRFDEYNGVFKNEIEHLSNEYILRIGKNGYVLDDVWEKCQQNYKKINEAWHDEAYEEDEMWRIRDEKTDYNRPYVDIETFK